MTSHTIAYYRVQRRVTEQRYDKEKMLRDERTLEFVQRAWGPISVQDLRRSNGLSFRQAVESLARLEYFGDVAHRQTHKWNGQHYIYPHEFWAR